MALQRLLVANRGEIAVRVMRSALAAGISVVGVAATDDRDAGHTRHADDLVMLPGSGPGAYLDVAAVVSAAIDSGCDAVHPGYGFLSESAEFAEAINAAGLVFVGPSVETLATFGDKTSARRVAERCGIPLPAGTVGATTLAEADAFMTSLGPGKPVMVKAVAGGGGRGMSPVHDREQLPAVFERCSSEAMKAFGSGALYIEELIDNARHIEVQIVGDGQGGVTHLWDRDCSLQRRRQKVIEIAPAELDEGLRARLLDHAVAIAADLKYRSLGTVEFLLRAEDIAFLEVNPRIQVEHTVTEELLGLDLVDLQLRIAAGATLDDLGLSDTPRDLPERSAMQLRIAAEQMQTGGTVFPSEGTLQTVALPAGPGVRVDTHIAQGSVITSSYDSLLAKIVLTQPGRDRRSLAARGRRALRELVVDGVRTNASLIDAVLSDEEFLAAPVTTDFIAHRLDELVAAQPVKPLGVLPVSSDVDDSAVGNDDVDDGLLAVRAPMTGVVVAREVEAGDVIRPGQSLVVIEAMKMEHVVTAERGGVVDAVRFDAGDRVPGGAVMIVLRPGIDDDDTAASTGTDDTSEQRQDFQEWQHRRDSTLDAGRVDAVQRRHARGGRTARENIADLLDDGSFVEYGGLVLAAQRRRMDIDDLVQRTPADGLVAGIGTVDGRSIAVMAYDYTVLAGTQGYFNHAKMRRMFHLAAEQELPVVMFVEGGGGRPGDTDMPGIAQLDEQTFTMAARLSGRVPLVAIASGRTFAGNAALASLSDLIIATRNCNIGMGGPAMIEGGGLGVFRPEEIGPASEQSRNGVIDVLVDDESEAVAVAVAYLGLVRGERVSDYEEHDQLLLRAAVPGNRKRSYDVRKVVELLADVGTVLELRPDFGPGILTGLARIHGRPVGVVANNSQHLGGAIDAPAAEKAARFLTLCDVHGLPVLSLVDTPGFMVGPASEQTATVRRFGRLFLAGANMRVPMIAVVLRKGYGLGAMAMTGGDFTVPLSTISWPTGEFGGMGLEGAVRLGYRNELAAIADPDEAQKRYDELVAELYERGKAISVASVNEIDDVIDPAQTRTIVSALFDAAGPLPQHSGGYLDAW